MPAAPKRPCSFPGCPNFQPCSKPEHNRHRKRDEERGNSRERGYSARWDVYSKWVRSQVHCECARNHWFCEHCKAERSEMVDHIKPADEYPELFWEHSNHQALCRKCHAIKTLEDRCGK